MRAARHLASVFVAAAALSCWQGCTRAPAEPNGPSAAGVAPATDGAVALDGRTRGWQAETRYGYRLKLSSAVSFGTSANAFDFDVDAVIDLVPTSVTEGSTTLYAVVREAAVASRVPESQLDYDKVAAQLRGASCFYTLTGGRVSELRLAKGLSAITANTLREVGACLQFSRPSVETASYSVKEYDTTGQYVAVYERDREPYVFHKRKERYLSILTDGAASARAAVRLVPEIVSSEGAVRLSPSGRPSSVRTRNEILVNGAQVPVRSITMLSLEAESEQAISGARVDWGAISAATDRLAVDQPYGGSSTVEALDDARIQGQTFEGIVAALEQAGRGDAGASAAAGVTGEDAKMFVGLAAIFRRDPDAITKAVEKIRAKSPAGPVLINALGSASTEEAQKALIALSGAAALNAASKSRVDMALARTPHPAESTVEQLEATLAREPFDESALFRLGSYARRLREDGKSARAAALGDLLIDRLRGASHEGATLTVLRAITNSGYTAALPEVKPFLTDKRDAVRAAAVRALQSMRAAEVDDLIAASITSDPSNQVRISAMDAAQVREPTAGITRSLADVAVRHADPHVRYRAVELMALWLPQYPDFRPTLARVADGDAVTRIRDRAKASL